MIKKTLAVIDLGSNTFHLLVVEQSDTGFETLYRERVYTFLSEGGLESISVKRLADAIEVIKHFSDKLIEYKVNHTRIIGTAALRTAKNSHALISQIKESTGLEVEVIDGDHEAHYIFEGIMCFDQLKQGNHIIMDIGGGSTELIIVDNGQRIWSKSYPLGIGLLYAKFEISDPISADEIKKITSFIKSTLSDFAQVLSLSNKSRTLIGASGSFEVLMTMSGKPIIENKIELISLGQFDEIYKMIIKSCHMQRQLISGLPVEREKLIRMAMLLKNIVINEVCKDVSDIIFCPYALKEGVLKEMSIIH